MFAGRWANELCDVTLTKRAARRALAGFCAPHTHQTPDIFSLVSPPVLQVLIRTGPPGEVSVQSSVPLATTVDASVCPQLIVFEFWLTLRAGMPTSSPNPSQNPAAGDRTTRIIFHTTRATTKIKRAGAGSGLFLI